MARQIAEGLEEAHRIDLDRSLRLADAPEDEAQVRKLDAREWVEGALSGPISPRRPR